MLINRNEARPATWLVAGLACAGMAQYAYGQEENGSPLADGFSYRVEVLGTGEFNDLVDSELNADNRLEIPDRETMVEVRADLFLEYAGFDFVLKPRANAGRRSFDAGPLADESESFDDAFVNEWRARYSFQDKVFVSYGRENLQWGPSFLFSPSNPFNPRNSRNNPWQEQPGLDYARVLWLPDGTWTVSVIANTDEGEAEFREAFEETYALKLDYTGEGRYFSLIPSHRESGPDRLGFFAGMTLSDATLVHAEGEIDDDGGSKMLLGGSYTFENAGTVVVEYYRNSEGCEDERIHLCFLPPNTTSQDEPLFRSDYYMLQYTDTEFFSSRTELTLRAIHNLDDGSDLVVGILGYDLNPRTELFTVVNLTSGDADSEFGSIVDSSVFAGVSLNF